MSKLFQIFILASLIISGFFALRAIQSSPQEIPQDSSQAQTVLILLGPPGSGKGTQAVEISKAMHIPHISTGDLFREHISQNTSLGKEAQSYMKQGKLVPDTLVVSMLFDRISQEDCAEGYLLDGFPRTVDQAVEFDKKLPKDTRATVLYLEVSDDAVMKRISGRLTCKACGSIYNRYFSPPKKEGICDQCGSGFAQREDDRPEVVQHRLKVYKEQTAPLVDYYQLNGVLKVIDGEASEGPQAIFEEIMAQLNRGKQQ